LVLAFVNEPAATGYECQNRDATLVPQSFDRRLLKDGDRSYGRAKNASDQHRREKP